VATAAIIDGKVKAAKLSASIAESVSELCDTHGIRPGLAVVIIGNNPASEIYVRNKKRAAKACGFHSVRHALASDVTQDDVLRLLANLNIDPTIHGILVQLPLPNHLDEELITQSIAPTKDVDGFHFQNIGKLAAGEINGTFVPCTPAGCMLMIEEQLGKDLSGLNAIIIGRSNIVGKPLASLLLKANATITIAHSRTNNLPNVCRNADILISAVGQPNMVKGEWVKPGAIVIDVGINRIEISKDDETGIKITGDVDFEDVRKVAGAITPVPGGVGPMTIAMLMANTLVSARRAANDPAVPTNLL
jgi:methylenetetrahydrofolate dehydrogenase (NADP+)/methenyltetrahydrofolate cyclohydrolase